MPTIPIPVTPETARALATIGAGHIARTLIIEAPAAAVAPVLEKLLAEHFGAATRPSAIEIRCDQPGLITSGRVRATLLGGATTTVDLRAHHDQADWFRFFARFVLGPAAGFVGFYLAYLAQLPPYAGAAALVGGIILAILAYFRISRAVAERWLAGANAAFDAIEPRLQEMAKAGGARG